MLETAIKKAFLTRCNVYDSNKNCIWEYKYNKIKNGGNKNEKSLQRNI